MTAITLVDGLAQTAFAVSERLTRRAGEADLSLAQIRLLGVLRDRRPTMRALARLLDLDKSSVTGLVDRAERRELVRRVPSARDGRVVEVELTDHGRRLGTGVADAFAADVGALVERLAPADRGTLARILGDLLVAEAAGRGVDLATQARTSGGAITE